jgi:hypothetical protein
LKEHEEKEQALKRKIEPQPVSPSKRLFEAQTEDEATEYERDKYLIQSEDECSWTDLTKDESTTEEEVLDLTKGVSPRLQTIQELKECSPDALVRLLKDLAPKVTISEELKALWLKQKIDGEEFVHFTEEKLKNYSDLPEGDRGKLWRLILEINNNFQTSNHALREPFKNSLQGVINRVKQQTSLGFKEVTAESSNYVTNEEVQQKIQESFVKRQQDLQAKPPKQLNQLLGYYETPGGSVKVARVSKGSKSLIYPCNLSAPDRERFDKLREGKKIDRWDEEEANAWLKGEPSPSKSSNVDSTSTE